MRSYMSEKAQKKRQEIKKHKQQHYRAGELNMYQLQTTSYIAKLISCVSKKKIPLTNSSHGSVIQSLPTLGLFYAQLFYFEAAKWRQKLYFYY